MKYLIIAFGGAAGAIARFALGGFINTKMGISFPYGTFAINITGSFILGLIMTLAVEKSLISPNVRLLLSGGFLGAYTTFSTFTYETIGLLTDGHIIRALAYVGGSVILGLFACWLGILLGRLM